MRSYIFILSLLLILISCEDKVNIDKLNYPLDTIKTAMMELYLASEAMNNRNPEVMDSLREIYRSQIESMHNIDLDLIEADILEIKRDADLYEKIHTEVADSMVNLEKRFQKKSKIRAPKNRNTPKK